MILLVIQFYKVDKEAAFPRVCPGAIILKILGRGIDGGKKGGYYSNH